MRLQGLYVTVPAIQAVVESVTTPHTTDYVIQQVISSNVNQNHGVVHPPVCPGLRVLTRWQTPDNPNTNKAK
jgi:hypothetical protein